MKYIAWLIKVPIYFFLLTLGAVLSGFIILRSMKKIIGYKGNDGTTKYATLYEYPKWAWLWMPYSESDIDGLKFYDQDRELCPFDIFRRRLAYFFLTKSNNFNVILLGVTINSYCRMKGNVNIIDRNKKIKYFSYLLLKTDNGNWRLLIRFRNCYLFDFGYKLGLNNNEIKLPYRARMICRVIKLGKDYKDED